MKLPKENKDLEGSHTEILSRTLSQIRLSNWQADENERLGFNLCKRNNYNLSISKQKMIPQMTDYYGLEFVDSHSTVVTIPTQLHLMAPYLFI